MTMFRRVFSQNFDDQGKATHAPEKPLPNLETAVAPPSAPPRLAKHAKSLLTEMVQTHPTSPTKGSDASDGAVEDPTVALPDPIPEPNPDLSARAAEVHAQIMQRTPQAPADPNSPSISAPSGLLEPPTSGSGVMPSPSRSGRARTRLLGFNAGADVATDPIERALAETPAEVQINPAGWVAITSGPGAGHHFAIFSGVSMIGRGEDLGIRLDFGDQAISRHNHAALAYDAEDNKFYLGHGGKSNIIKRNGRPVLSTEEIFHGDTIRIGETTLRFVALCGDTFQWETHNDE